MRRKRLLACDLSNQLWKAVAVNPSLASGDTYTGGLYGFIVALQKAIRVCEADTIVICRDTKPYRRSLLYPEYKALRVETRDPEMQEKVQASLPLINELCKILNWPVWGLEGFESDDLIAHCVVQHRHRYQKIIAMSNDADLYQLFKCQHFCMYKGKGGLYTYQDYMKEWNTDPSHMPTILALSGTHNEVEGIQGIGPVNARRIALDPLALRQKRQTHANIIDRNLELIKLPHPEFPRGTSIPTPGDFNERALLRFAGRFDINIHQSTCEAFAQVGNRI